MCGSAFKDLLFRNTHLTSLFYPTKYLSSTQRARTRSSAFMRTHARVTVYFVLTFFQNEKQSDSEQWKVVLVKELLNGIPDDVILIGSDVKKVISLLATLDIRLNCQLQASEPSCWYA